MPDVIESPLPHEIKIKIPKGGVPPPFETMCDWAQDGLMKALDGMKAVSGGVVGYGVGSRHVRFRDAADAQKGVDYWAKLVEFYCGVDALPTAITGRDTAFRVIERDV